MKQYQGHAGQGGLQKHSVGDCYPFTVFGQGDPTVYGVLNATTGEETAAIFTAGGAWDLAEAFKLGALSDLTDFDGQLKYLDRLHNFGAWPIRTAAEEVPAGCQWFARCDRPATGTTPHPILGAVPTCDRCAAFAKG